LKVNDEKKEFEVTTEHKERETKQKEMLRFATKPMTCCVSVIDIVNSTKTTALISESKIGLFYSMFLNYISDIVNEYGGIVVKNIGDSLLYYFDKQKESDDPIISSFNCNLSIIKKRFDLNKKFEDVDLPKISYRVSSDYGKVFVATSTISSTNDIFGATVNMCAKINHVGNSNEFFIGNDLYLNSKNLKEFNFEEIDGSELNILKNPYPIYYVKQNLNK